MNVSDFTTGSTEREDATADLAKTETTNAVSAGLVGSTDKSGSALKGKLFSTGTKSAGGVAHQGRTTAASTVHVGSRARKAAGGKGASALGGLAAHKVLEDSELEGTDDVVKKSAGSVRAMRAIKQKRKLNVKKHLAAAGVSAAKSVTDGSEVEGVDDVVNVGIKSGRSAKNLFERASQKNVTKQGVNAVSANKSLGQLSQKKYVEKRKSAKSVAAKSKRQMRNYFKQNVYSTSSAAKTASSKKAAAGVFGKTKNLVAAIGTGTLLPILLGVLGFLLALMLLQVILAADNSSQDNNGAGYGNLEGNCLVICKYLRGKGVPDMTIAAICGNIFGESGYLPEAVEGNGEGHGICQWSFGRKLALYAYAKEKDKAWTDINLQLDFLWNEIESDYAATFEATKAQTSVREATIMWHDGFEKSLAGCGQNRIDEAERVYAELQKGGTGSGDIVALVQSKVGCPYWWAAEGPDKFDCSGLVKWCYDQAGRTGLIHQSQDQYAQCTIISQDEAQPGDIVGWGIGDACYHVGIYIGDGKCISANGSGYTGSVMETSVHYFNGTLWFGKYGR